MCGGTQCLEIAASVLPDGGWSIPACAGEPYVLNQSCCPNQRVVYPRVCGGTVRQPVVLPSKSWTPRVYPRVCGGTNETLPSNELDAGVGLSPRVRGNH